MDRIAERVSHTSSLLLSEHKFPWCYWILLPFPKSFPLFLTSERRWAIRYWDLSSSFWSMNFHSRNGPVFPWISQRKICFVRFTVDGNRKWSYPYSSRIFHDSNFKKLAQPFVSSGNRCHDSNSAKDMEKCVFPCIEGALVPPTVRSRVQVEFLYFFPGVHTILEVNFEFLQYDA